MKRKSKLMISLEKRKYYPYFNYLTKEEIDSASKRLIESGYKIIKVRKANKYTLYCKKA